MFSSFRTYHQFALVSSLLMLTLVAIANTQETELPGTDNFLQTADNSTICWCYQALSDICGTDTSAVRLESDTFCQMSARIAEYLTGSNLLAWCDAQEYSDSELADCGFAP